MVRTPILMLTLGLLVLANCKSVDDFVMSADELGHILKQISEHKLTQTPDDVNEFRTRHDMIHKERNDTNIKTKHPVIGILTHDLPSKTFGQEVKPGTTYILSDYAKWIQAAGARVVPIHWKRPIEQIIEKLNKVNGLLLPGGGEMHFFKDGGVSDWGTKMKQIWEYVIKTNEDGTHFPMFGVCLGFQHMAMAVDHDNVVEPYLAKFHSDPLEYILHPNQTKLFSYIPNDIYKASIFLPITYNSHKYGIGISTMQKNPSLAAHFRPLTISYTTDTHKPYVSTYEHNKHPIFATQFHPEKNAYRVYDKTSTKDLSNIEEAIELSHHFAKVFVGETKYNSHRYESYASALKDLIQNNPITLTPTGGEYYLFSPDQQ